jgi:hypothetical protein
MKLLLSEFGRRQSCVRLDVGRHETCFLEKRPLSHVDAIAGVAGEVEAGVWVGFFSRHFSVQHPQSPDYTSSFNVFVGSALLSDEAVNPRIVFVSTKLSRTVEISAGGIVIGWASQRTRPIADWWRNLTYKGMLEDSPPTILQLLEEVVPSWRPGWIADAGSSLS